MPGATPVSGESGPSAVSGAVHGVVAVLRDSCKAAGFDLTAIHVCNDPGADGAAPPPEEALHRDDLRVRMWREGGGAAAAAAEHLAPADGMRVVATAVATAARSLERLRLDLLDFYVQPAAEDGEIAPEVVYVPLEPLRKVVLRERDVPEGAIVCDDMEEDGEGVGREEVKAEEEVTVDADGDAHLPPVAASLRADTVVRQPERARPSGPVRSGPAGNQQLAGGLKGEEVEMAAPIAPEATSRRGRAAPPPVSAAVAGAPAGKGAVADRGVSCPPGCASTAPEAAGTVPNAQAAVDGAGLEAAAALSSVVPGGEGGRKSVATVVPAPMVDAAVADGVMDGRQASSVIGEEVASSSTPAALRSGTAAEKLVDAGALVDASQRKIVAAVEREAGPDRLPQAATKAVVATNLLHAQTTQRAACVRAGKEGQGDPACAAPADGAKPTIHLGEPGVTHTDAAPVAPEPDATALSQAAGDVLAAPSESPARISQRGARDCGVEMMGAAAATTADATPPPLNRTATDGAPCSTSPALAPRQGTGVVGETTQKHGRAAEAVAGAPRSPPPAGSRSPLAVTTENVESAAPAGEASSLAKDAAGPAASAALVAAPSAQNAAARALTDQPPPQRRPVATGRKWDPARHMQYSDLVTTSIVGLSAEEKVQPGAGIRTGTALFLTRSTAASLVDKPWFARAVQGLFVRAWAVCGAANSGKPSSFLCPIEAVVETRTAAYQIEVAGVVKTTNRHVVLDLRVADEPSDMAFALDSLCDTVPTRAEFAKFRTAALRDGTIPRKLELDRLLGRARAMAHPGAQATPTGEEAAGQVQNQLLLTSLQQLAAGTSAALPGATAAAVVRVATCLPVPRLVQARAIGRTVLQRKRQRCNAAAPGPPLTSAEAAVLQKEREEARTGQLAQERAAAEAFLEGRKCWKERQSRLAAEQEMLLESARAIQCRRDEAAKSSAAPLAGEKSGPVDKVCAADRGSERAGAAAVGEVPEAPNVAPAPAHVAPAEGERLDRLAAEQALRDAQQMIAAGGSGGAVRDGNGGPPAARPGAAGGGEGGDGGDGECVAIDVDAGDAAVGWRRKDGCVERDPAAGAGKAPAAGRAAEESDSDLEIVRVDGPKFNGAGGGGGGGRR